MMQNFNVYKGMNPSVTKNVVAFIGHDEGASARAELRDEANIHWLGRNLAIQNSTHPQIEEARELLETAGARMVL